MRTSKFLFAMWEGGGTGPPELAVVGRLVARGHAVTVLGDPSLSQDVGRAGASFVPWRDAPHRKTRTAESEIVKDWAALTPLGAFARARDRHAFRPAHLFAREVRELFDREGFDGIASDAMLFGALVGAEATRAPFAAMIPMTSFLPEPDRPPPGLGLMPARGLLGRLRDRALYTLGDALLWRSCLPYLNQARAAVGLSPVDHPLEQITRADRVLVQTSPWFDFRATPRSGNVRYVGPELGDPSWVAPFDAPWSPANRDPLVLVAFSTTFMGHAALLERVIRALSPLAVRGVVTTGPGLDPRTLRAPPHIAVRASAPHAAILREAALVITHAGHGTVIRTLANGVPLIAMPMGRDQSDNAARVVAAGAGIWLSPRSSETTLRSAVERALSDSSLREGATRARDILAHERAGDRAVEELEALVRGA